MCETIFNEDQEHFFLLLCGMVSAILQLVKRSVSTNKSLKMNAFQTFVLHPLFQKQYTLETDPSNHKQITALNNRLE
jgi:hypothetical protein